MSKDRNIDDAELANISGAGDLESAEVKPAGLAGSQPSKGGGGSQADVIENDADTGGDQEMGPA